MSDTPGDGPMSWACAEVVRASIGAAKSPARHVASAMQYTATVSAAIASHV